MNRPHKPRPPVRRHLPRCGLTGKDSYIDRIAADLTLTHVQCHSRRHDHTEKRSYQCLHCGFYHLTSQDQKTEVATPHST